jgi:hypothetical protein
VFTNTYIKTTNKTPSCGGYINHAYVDDLKSATPRMVSMMALMPMIVVKIVIGLRDCDVCDARGGHKGL